MNKNSKILYTGILAMLYKKLLDNEIVEVRGHKTVEVMNFTEKFDAASSCIINVKDIFKTSEKYTDRELEWYNSMNPNNKDIAEHAQI